MRYSLAAGIVLASIGAGVVGYGQTLSGSALVRALERGGFVIVMRHASSPMSPPAADAAEPNNRNHERQLDDAGKGSAEAMGNALRRLHIPIGRVMSSPMYRALETARYAGLTNVKTYPELGDRGQSMSGASDADAEWLRRQVDQLPDGPNTLVITHYPNIQAAFPRESQGLKDGEALVFGPDGHGGTALVARVPIEEWPTLQP